MSISIIGSSTNRLRQKFSQSVGLPIREALPEDEIEAALEAEDIIYRRCLLDPVVTIWAFLSQVLDSDRSCRKAISRVFAYLSDTKEVADPMDLIESQSDTGAYCKARQRLSQPVLDRLYRSVATNQEESAEKDRLWCGRRVFLGDGTTVLMPDTQENQAAHPQHPNQKAGCGFPLAKLVAIFSLTTGAIIEAITDVWSAYEPALLRQISGFFKPFDVFVADRIYCTYADIVLLKNRLVDSVLRLHQARKVDFRKGKRLGKYDHIFIWEKPKRCPKALAKHLYDLLPNTLTVRVLRFTINQKGFRSRQITVVTTLLDPIAFPKAEIARLYGLRWEAEINLRHLKSSMEMDFLRTKSPEMIQKELAIYFLAYNLIRSLMTKAALRYGKDPLRLSFKGTLQHLNTFLPLLAVSGLKKRQQHYEMLLLLIAREQLPDRPGRVEPRMVKRRPKWSRWLQEPRAVLKQKLSA